MNKLTEELLKEFDEIGFGNQARIVGVKRVELKDFLRSRIDTLLQKEREAIYDDWEVAIRFSENEDESILSREVMENHLRMSKEKKQSDDDFEFVGGDK